MSHHHYSTTDHDGFHLTVSDPGSIARSDPLTAGMIEVLIVAPDGDGAAVDLDPIRAGQVADVLHHWSIAHGRIPPPAINTTRWHLPRPDVLAVLLEQRITGEDPTMENLERYAAALWTASIVAEHLPEALGLLEHLNPVVGAEAEIVDDGYSGPTHPTDRWRDQPGQWQEVRLEQSRLNVGVMPVREFTHQQGLVEEWYLRFPGGLASTDFLGAEVRMSPCEGCDLVVVGSVAEIRQHDEDTAELVLEVGRELNPPGFVAPDPAQAIPYPVEVTTLIAAAHNVVETIVAEPFSITGSALGVLSLALTAIDPETSLSQPGDAPTAAIVDRGDLFDLLDMIEGHEGRTDFATNAARLARIIRRQVSA